MKRAILAVGLMLAACGGTEEDQQGECYEYELGNFCVPEGFTRTEFCWQTNEPCDGGETIRCMTIREDGRGTVGDVFSHCGNGDWDCYAPDLAVNDETCCTGPDAFVGNCS